MVLGNPTVFVTEQAQQVVIFVVEVEHIFLIAIVEIITVAVEIITIAVATIVIPLQEVAI
jgi:hypothetical protein